MSDSADRKKGTYMISAVAELYDIHPQTLRMYERGGLLQPSRSGGNTRQYTDADLRRLEVVLSLTRDLGVNLAGVEVIMNMRSNMERLQREVADLMCFVRDELLADRDDVPDRVVRALVRLERGAIVVSRRREKRE
jgi:MerR family transcriptional regulator/heat shock protein HspR